MSGNDVSGLLADVQRAAAVYASDARFDPLFCPVSVTFAIAAASCARAQYELADSERAV
ncbi:hypothetical protein EVJ58_g6325 [Rhodofomes roseus]|uniref:Uncharacterized protein n=1 Tax=Rhodofomes roseus TaxID=34475 RepID=A0A4Y9YAL7_9APHY|nr:hypothetical protein EVJ58_g6325 [Rhodofomes roseus]